MGLIIRSSAIHAAGCYTTTAVAKGARIVEYTGPRITKEAADEKYSDSYLTYLFGLGDGTFVIDGHCAAMFINHSCDANCETEEIEGRVWVIAITDIPAGAELVYDYNLYDGGDDEAVCNCGSSSCRKTMYSQEELARRKKALRVKSRRKKAAKKRAAESKRIAEKKKTARKPVTTGTKSSSTRAVAVSRNQLSSTVGKPAGKSGAKSAGKSAEEKSRTRTSDRASNHASRKVSQAK